MCKHSASSRIQLTILKRTEISDCDFLFPSLSPEEEQLNKNKKKTQTNEQERKDLEMSDLKTLQTSNIRFRLLPASVRRVLLKGLIYS